MGKGSFICRIKLKDILLLSIAKIRATIDCSFHRWEAAYYALVENFDSDLAEVSERLQMQKDKLAEKSKRLKRAITTTQNLSPEQQDKIITKLNHLKVQLKLSRAETHDAVDKQQAIVLNTLQTIDNQLMEFERIMDQEIEKEIEAWLRASIALRQEFELAALRYQYELPNRRVLFESHRQSFMEIIKPFQKQLFENRFTVVENEKIYSPVLVNSLEQVKEKIREIAAKN